MSWYKESAETRDNDNGSQQGWEDDLGDVQRYIFDPYTARVYITRLEDSTITVSATLHHIWSGGISWQEFWRFHDNEEEKARKTYGNVCKIAAEVLDKFRSNIIPNSLIHTHLREEFRFVDQQYKPSTRIPYIDWARSQPGVADWRNSIYGTRYPKSDGF